MKKLILTLLMMVSFMSSAIAMTYDEASTQNKTIVILFKEHYCSACKKFEPTFDRMASKFSKKFNFVKEDANSSALASKLGIQSIPAVFIINPKTQSSYKISSETLWDSNSLENTLNSYGK